MIDLARDLFIIFLIPCEGTDNSGVLVLLLCCGECSQEVVAKRDSNEMRTGDLTFADRSFLNELSLTIEQATAAYEGYCLSLCFHEALGSFGNRTLFFMCLFFRGVLSIFRMLFRQALKHSWFELTNKRDQYRKMCNAGIHCPSPFSLCCGFPVLLALLLCPLQKLTSSLERQVHA